MVFSAPPELGTILPGAVIGRRAAGGGVLAGLNAGADARREAAAAPVSPAAALPMLLL
jgi:hypothetical protein